MKVLNTAVLRVAIAGVAWVPLETRQLLRTGNIVASPMLVSTIAL